MPVDLRPLIVQAVGSGRRHHRNVGLTLELGPVIEAAAIPQYEFDGLDPRDVGTQT
jgi:hypothetical protein